VLLGIDVRDSFDGLAMARVTRVAKSVGIHLGRTRVLVLLSMRAKPRVKLEGAKTAISAAPVFSVDSV
jgi:hypothetical protein